MGAMDVEIAKTPMKRMADAEEIGDCVVFLANSMASFMTGSCLLVDGGYTINWNRMQYVSRISLGICVR
jgi:enoyl-[acyl-carrier-protein] reductase (NADH)